MSVSLIEVIEAGGYNLKTEEDARWLLGTQAEYERLVEEAYDLVTKVEEAEMAEAELEYERRFA